MIPFALASFLGAFLLFAVQPLLGRYVMPTFGGAPAIWSVCLVFFQTALLGGYLYAHRLSRLLPQRRQVLIHGILLASAFLFLPPIPTNSGLTHSTDFVAWRVLGLLLQTIGLPFMIMAATGPLIQSWFSRSFPDRSPYRLFALSNAGSLLGLLTYPILIEPNFDRATQAWGWSGGFLLLAVVLIKCGLIATSPTPDAPPTPTPPPTTTAIPFSLRLSWISWAALGSGLLVATSTALTHDVAGVPFLWIAPLTVYLLTFIIAFDHSRWYHRPTLGGALVVASVVIIDATDASSFASFPQLGAAYCFSLFAAGLVCHGELYYARPKSTHLTTFYLHIAAGGAIGSLLTALVAPAVFNQYLELPILWTAVLSWFVYGIFRSRSRVLALGMSLGALLSPVFVVVFRSIDSLVFGASRWSDFWDDLSHNVSASYNIPIIVTCTTLAFVFVALQKSSPRPWHRQAVLVMGIIPVALGIGWWKLGINHDPAAIFVDRNTFGTITVSDHHSEKPRAHVRYLAHGTTTHGIQLMHPDYQRWPTTYYGPESGIELAFSSADQSSPREVGVVGLGVGTLAGYGRSGDNFHFYEIDATMVEVAKTHFTALALSAAHIEVKIGDGRLLLAAERAKPNSHLFDLLVIDAFSSDAVPIHLLTREAFSLYESRLKPDGVLIVNVSNRLVDIRNVVLAQAHAAGLTAAPIFHRPSTEDWWAFASEWILLARAPSRLQHPTILEAAAPAVAIPDQPYLDVWTDDFSSLWSALR